MQDQNKFNFQARFLHWVSAVVIIWASISGFLILNKGITEQTRYLIGEFNVAATTIFIPFFCWRIVNRVRVGVPHYSCGIDQRGAFIAKAIHLVIYFFVSLVLISGVFMMDREISLFGLINLPQPLTEQSWLVIFETIHKYSTRALAALVLLHVLALIRHQISGKNILARMI